VPSVPLHCQWHTITVSGFCSVVEQFIAVIDQVICVVIIFLSKLFGKLAVM
jgi:hypothetical protein